MIFDTTDIPEDSYERMGKIYAKALARSERSYKWLIELHVLQGWTTEQHQHWVETGEEPKA